MWILHCSPDCLKCDFKVNEEQEMGGSKEESKTHGWMLRNILYINRNNDNLLIDDICVTSIKHNLLRHLMTELLCTTAEYSY